jgi:hypothetical protein
MCDGVMSHIDAAGYGMGVAVSAPDVVKLIAVVGALVSAAWAFGPPGLAVGCGVVWVIGWAMSVSGGRQ